MCRYLVPLRLRESQRVTSAQRITRSTTDYSASDNSVIPTLLTMTFVTGLVDAVSYLGPGQVFTANMTGNVALLGFAVAGASRLSVARSLTSLFAFVLGAVLGGRLGLTFSDV